VLSITTPRKSLLLTFDILYAFIGHKQSEVPVSLPVLFPDNYKWVWFSPLVFQCITFFETHKHLEASFLVLAPNILQMLQN
jgi:hypothetical protein